jgi:acetyltransferase-like isoleucine patch superfamily enzyme
MSKNGHRPHPKSLPLELVKQLLGRITKVTSIVRARVELRGCTLGPWVRATGVVRVTNTGGRIILDRSVSIRGGLEPTELLTGEGRILYVGDGSVINYGVRLDARFADIEFGRNCLTGAGVRVLTAPDRPVLLEDDVWIAHGAVIEPGVHVGRGSVIGAGAVVKTDVPAGCLAIGNPARIMSLELAQQRS